MPSIVSNWWTIDDSDWDAPGGPVDCHGCQMPCDVRHAASVIGPPPLLVSFWLCPRCLVRAEAAARIPKDQPVALVA